MIFIEEPLYLTAARKYDGQSETDGPNNSPFLRSMWARLHASWLLGKPWCGGLLATAMADAGMAYPAAYYRASAWLEWGVPITEPLYGCVVVFERAGGGHVGIVVGENANGDLLVYGGNQGDKVCTRAFPRKSDKMRVIGYRAPIGIKLPALTLGSATQGNSVV